MPLIPLLILLVTLSLGASWTHADDAARASTISVGTMESKVSRESTYGGPAAEPGSTAAGTFDPSLLVVMILGVGGLVWIRRHAQSL